MQSSFPRWSPSKNNNILDEIANGGGVLDPSLDHQIKYHEVARRQPLLLQWGVARPALIVLALEGKAKEEFLNSARRGHEDDGGEGSVSQRKGDTPEGWRFLPSPHWTRLSLSLESESGKWKLSLLLLWSIVIFLSVVNQIPCDQGGMPKHVMDVWEEKINEKLELLSFEKAWDKIERDNF